MSAIDRRRLFVVIVAAIPFEGSQAVMAQPVSVYSHEQWYVARPEPEAHYEGRLMRRPVTRSPGNRSALRFSLRTDEDIAIYAPDQPVPLENLVDRNVMIVGKLVDLTSEGLGKELWVGSVTPAPK